jgi:hypothetical protein
MPVKSFSISEAQFNRVSERRPDLVAIAGSSGMVARPYRDYLEVHYAFPDTDAFRREFAEMFNRVVEASSKEEAPRGVILSFRDRPNRNLAETLFWPVFLQEGRQWVEATWIAVPEQPEPESGLGNGFQVREATEADRAAIAELDAAASGQPLSDAGVTSIYEDARWLQVVTDSSGVVVAYLSLRTEPGGWAVIQEAVIGQDVRERIGEPLYRWAVAFLRNNGGRRQRRRVYLDDAAELTLLRDLGFSPGEAGLDYHRPVDASEVEGKIDERKSHGWFITLGDWR